MMRYLPQNSHTLGKLELLTASMAPLVAKFSGTRQPRSNVLYALGQLAKGFQPAEPGALAQGLLIFVGENVLKHVAPTNGSTKFGVAIAQRASSRRCSSLRLHSLPCSSQSDPFRSAP
jgi:hypothetical protein